MLKNESERYLPFFAYNFFFFVFLPTLFWRHSKIIAKYSDWDSLSEFCWAKKLKLVHMFTSIFFFFSSFCP